MKSLIIFAFAAVIASPAQFGASLPASDTCKLAFSGTTVVFDREHDRDTVGGGSLYCRLTVTATQANQAIADFKSAVSTPDKPPAGRVLKFPVEVVALRKFPGAKVNDSIIMLNTRMEWANFVRQKFNSDQLAAIRQARLSDMLIVNSKGGGPGFILGDGLVFFSTRNAKRISVSHLNLGDLRK